MLEGGDVDVRGERVERQSFALDQQCWLSGARQGAAECEEGLPHAVPRLLRAHVTP